MTLSRVMLESSVTGQPSQEQQSAIPGNGNGEWALRQEPAEYYRAAAARARALERDTTTPRVKMHLRELIERYERLAGEVERTAEREPPNLNGARFR
jgi:hypothetical protein